MKFKLIFDEKIKKLRINCLNSLTKQIQIPDNVSDHVHYPVPAKLIQETKRVVSELVPDELSDELIQITEQIQELSNKRQNIVKEYRKILNPKIIQA